MLLLLLLCVLLLSPVFNSPETPEIAIAFPNEFNLDYFQLNFQALANLILVQKATF
jgi:hypothetical protein